MRVFCILVSAHLHKGKECMDGGVGNRQTDQHPGSYLLAEKSCVVKTHR